MRKRIKPAKQMEGKKAVENTEVPALKEAAFYFLVAQTVSYSAATLALLPPRVRRELLRHLPAAELWRLETCPQFVEEMDMEAVWRERVVRHISNWVAPADLAPPPLELGLSYREYYLAHFGRLLLCSTARNIQQSASPYHGLILGLERESTVLVGSVFQQRKRVCFRLSFVVLQAPATCNEVDGIAELVDREKYIDFLYYGVFMEKVPSLWMATPYLFDPKKEYHFPDHYRRTSSGSYADRLLQPLSAYSNPTVLSAVQRYSEMIGHLSDCTGWGPKALDLVFPPDELVKSISDKTVLNFLRFVEEININLTSDLSFSDIAEVLEGLLRHDSPLVPTSLRIEVHYFHQLSWILPRLGQVCGQSTLGSPGAKVGYSRLKSIEIAMSKEAEGDVTHGCEWSKVLFHEEIESIVLRRLQTCVPPDLCRSLSYLLVTRPSIRVIELTNCSVGSSEMQLLVSTFLRTPTSHTQTLTITQWDPSPTTHDPLHDAKCRTAAPEEATVPEMSAALAETLKLLCQTNNKVLCIPFISSGPCSLPWLLSLPQLTLHDSLELTVPYHRCREQLLKILESLSSSDSFPVEGVTVNVESRNPSSVESMCSDVIIDLTMCQYVGEVRLTKI